MFSTSKKEINSQRNFISSISDSLQLGKAEIQCRSQNTLAQRMLSPFLAVSKSQQIAAHPCGTKLHWVYFYIRTLIPLLVIITVICLEDHWEAVVLWTQHQPSSHHHSLLWAGVSISTRKWMCNTFFLPQTIKTRLSLNISQKLSNNMQCPGFHTWWEERREWFSGSILEQVSNSSA